MSIFSHRIMTLGLTMTALTCTTGVFAHPHHHKRHDRREERREERQSRRSSRHSVSISDFRENCFPKPLIEQLKYDLGDHLAAWFYALNQIIEEWGATPDKDPTTNESLGAFIGVNELIEEGAANLFCQDLEKIGVGTAEIAEIQVLFAHYNANALAYVDCLNQINSPALLDAITCSDAATYAAFVDAATNLGHALARISCDEAADTIAFVSRVQYGAYLQGNLAQAALGVLVDTGVSPDDQSTEGAAQAEIALKVLQNAKSIGSDLAAQVARCQCKRIRR